MADGMKITPEEMDKRMNGVSIEITLEEYLNHSVKTTLAIMQSLTEECLASNNPLAALLELSQGGDAVIGLCVRGTYTLMHKHPLLLDGLEVAGANSKSVYGIDINDLEKEGR